MYSVVLMAALTTGGSAPDCWFHGCSGGGHGSGHGHHGNYGYSGYVSSTCYGCYGGSYYGAPFGPSCYGCYGGGHFGGYGGAWGYGGGVDYACFGCHGCYGCYNSYSCGGFNPYGQEPMPPEQIGPPKAEEKKAGSGGSGSVNPNRAKVIVQLPADAKLYVDDHPIKATSENQTFSTPRLEPGQTYFYEVRAEAIRDGKTVVESKRVLVKAGQEVTVAFPKLEKDVAGIAAADVKRGR
jgi:uncharacterized protein (TIGR03000 family)